MNRTLIIVLILIVILVGALVLFYFRLNQSVTPIAPVNLPTITNQAVNLNENVNLPMPTVNTQTPTINNANKPDFQPASISIANFSFNPQTLNVKIGTTVTWTNDDPVPHQPVGSIFSSQILNTGDSYSFTFTQAGTYNYHCAIHPSMTGQIIVQ